MITVLVVDDQPVVRAGVRRILSSADGFTVIGECADGDEVPHAVALGGALSAGAAGYVLKDTSAEQLITATAAVACGGAWLDPSVSLARRTDSR